jgi:hypothetical protein
MAAESCGRELPSVAQVVLSQLFVRAPRRVIDTVCDLFLGIG